MKKIFALVLLLIFSCSSESNDDTASCPSEPQLITLEVSNITLNEVVFSITTPSGNQFLYKGAEELALYTNGLFPENVDSAVLIAPGIIPVMCN